MAGQTVGDVQQTRQVLALALFGRRTDELVAVLEDEEAPRARVLVVSVLTALVLSGRRNEGMQEFIAADEFILRDGVFLDVF